MVTRPIGRILEEIGLIPVFTTLPPLIDKRAMDVAEAVVLQGSLAAECSIRRPSPPSARRDGRRGSRHAFSDTHLICSLFQQGST